MHSVKLLVMLALTVFAGLAAAQDVMEDVAENADAAEENAGAENEKPTLLVVPRSLNVSRNLSFDEHGLFTRSSTSCRLYLNAKIGGGYKYAAYESVNVDEALTDTGDDLAVGEPSRHHSYIRRGGNDSSFSFQVSLADPPPGAQWLNKVTGTVKLFYTDGETKKAVIGPISKMENKKLQITGLDKPLELKITRRERTESAYVHLDRDDVPRIVEVAFYADGEKIRTHGMGSSSSGGDFKQSFSNVDLPDDGEVRITVLKKIKQADVPFRVEAIPLLDPERTEEGNREGVVEIKAVDPEDVNKEEGDLKVEPENAADDVGGELP